MLSSVKAYIDGSGLCPICGSNFHSRLRVIAHVSYVRRPKCGDRLLSGECPKLSPAALSKLEAQDKVLLKAARREGRTHVIAVGFALTLEGKRVGHVSL